MTSPKATLVRIAEKKSNDNLSKGQKRFNTLIKDIDVQRKQLESWQSAIPLYQRKRSKEFEPLLSTFSHLRIDLVHALDKAYAEKGLGKPNKAIIRDIICEICGEIIDQTGDESLKAIYNRYSEDDFDAALDEEKLMLKGMMESMLGVDLDDEMDYSSPEQMFAHMGEKMRQKQAEESLHRETYAERQSKRKKSPRQLASEARQQAEQQNISQSIREVYRKLASALHPDREQDTSERARKTALMQRVNVAYDNKDLLRLLELQLEVEQIDQNMINSLSEDRLKYYNKILAEQLAELKCEVQNVEFSFRMQFNFSPRERLSQTTIFNFLQADIKLLEQDIAGLRNDLASFQEIKNLKKWLKRYCEAERYSADNDLFGGFDFDAPF